MSGSCKTISDRSRLVAPRFRSQNVKSESHNESKNMGLPILLRSNSTRRYPSFSLFILGILVIFVSAAQPALRNVLTRDESISEEEKYQSRELIETESIVHRDVWKKMEYLWQNPSNQEQISAMLLVAHGCKHSATDWFPPSTTCPDCLGLPEEKAIVQSAREKGMLVVAISSRDRQKKCWLPSDGPLVAKILRQLKRQHVLSSQGKDQVPIYALGSSSGAELIGTFLPFYGLEHDPPQNSNLLLQGIIAQNKVPSMFYNSTIPAVYIALPRESVAQIQVSSYREGPTKQINLSPYRIDGSYFHNRIPDKIPLDLSEHLYQSIREAELIDENGVVLENPRSNLENWRSLLEPILQQSNIDDSLMPDESALLEVLNVAYGHHQTTRDGVSQALDWLMLQQRRRKYW